MAGKTYTAFVIRQGHDWLGEVPALDGASTYASTLAELRENLREVVILADELEDDAEVNIELDFSTASTAVRDAADLNRLRQTVTQELAVLRVATPAAARNLLDQGFSVQDTAEMIGITPGRVLHLATQTLIEA